MRILLVAVVVTGCGASQRPAATASATTPLEPTAAVTPDAAPPPAQVAYIDPDDGGEVASQGAGPTGGMAPGGGASGGIGSTGGTGAGYGAPVRQPDGAKVVLGTAAVTGELEPAIVRRIFAIHRNELRYCYEQHLRADPSATGVVVAKLEIDGDGKVTAQSASGIHADIEACLTNRFATWRFPRPKTGTLKITQPITFSPQ